MRQIQRQTNGWLPAIFNELIETENWPHLNTSHTPAINVAESENDYRIELAAPGMNKEDFNIRLDADNDLVIKMEKKTESKEGDNPKDEKVRYIRREFSYSKFQQTMILPEDVDCKAITAKMENGILTVTLPKIVVKEEPKVAQTIEIN